MSLLDEERHRRLITRLLNELQHYSSVGIRKAFDGGLSEALVFTILLREHCRRRPYETVRGLSINGVAASLSRPFETVRRYAQALQSTNLVCITAHGVVLGERAPAMSATLTHLLAGRFDMFVADLVRAGLWRSDAPDREPSEKALAAIDLYLSAIEFDGQAIKNWPMHLILGSILILNVRHIARDLGLSLLYARFEDVPPMELRLPVTVKEIVADNGMQIESVRRYLKQALAAGQVAEAGNGYIVPVAYLRNPEVQERALRILAYMRRVLADYGAGAYEEGGEMMTLLNG